MMPSTLPPAPFEAYLDVSKTLIMIIASMLMALGALVFVWHTRANTQGNLWTGDTVVPLGLGVVLFFVMATVSFKGYATYQQGRSGPIVRIDETGILDRRLNPAPIPWAAIGAAKIADIANTRMTKRGDADARLRPQTLGVRIDVEDAARYLDGEGALAATAKTLSAVTGYQTITLSPEGLHTSAEALLDAIAAHRP